MLAVITGASRGMGKAMALKFAKAGYDLLLCSRTMTTLETTRGIILKAAPERQVHLFAADLSIKEEVQKFADYCNSFGTADILINNAGTYTPGNCIDEADNAMEKIMDLNFYSAYHLTRMLLPKMMERKSGHIFNMCSIASLRAYRGGGSYGVSKYALLGFTKNIRLELTNFGIKVTAVFPGAVLTDSWGDFDNSENRIMVVDDIADMIFAASQLSPQAVVEDIVIRPQLGDMD
jgi:short-subunit dehydrogenase